MAIKTGIQFADSTVNGIAGCDGCELWPHDPKVRAKHPEKRICYAGVITERMLKDGPRKGWPESFDIPALFPGRIESATKWKDLTGTKREAEPWRDGMPRIIFCDDMGDRWTASLPIDSLAPTLPAIARSPHIYLFLTKRPDRAAEFSRQYILPENLWLGTTITSSQDQRLRSLHRARAAVRWVSYEPILADAGDVVLRHPWVQWWVFGGSSGDEAVSTDIVTIHAGISGCRETGAAPFVKQLGACTVDSNFQDVFCNGDRHYTRPTNDPFIADCKARIADGRAPGYKIEPHRMRLRDRKGGDWSEWQESLKIREYPKVT